MRFIISLMGAMRAIIKEIKRITNTKLIDIKNISETIDQKAY
jgi:hypothetical protein